MTVKSSKQAEMRQILRAVADEFVQAHCAFGEDDTVQADLFMESFVRFMQLRHADITCLLGREYVTAAWLVAIIQGQCPLLKFVGNNPRVSADPFTYKYIFKPTTVVGVRLTNLTQLW